jgi:hypothetical protein
MSLRRSLLLQTEEGRPGPSAAGYEARDLGQRATAFAAIKHTAFDNGDLMGDAAPFPQ